MTEEKELEIKAEQIVKVELGGQGISEWVNTPFGEAKAFKTYKELPKTFKLTGNLCIEVARKDDGLIDHITVTSIKETVTAQSPPNLQPAIQAIKELPDAKAPTQNAFDEPHGEKWLTKLIQANETYLRVKFGTGHWFTIDGFVTTLTQPNFPARMQFNDSDLRIYSNGKMKLYDVASRALKGLTHTGILEEEIGYPIKYKFKQLQASMPKGDPRLQETFRTLQDTMK